MGVVRHQSGGIWCIGFVLVSWSHPHPNSLPARERELNGYDTFTGWLVEKRRNTLEILAPTEILFNGIGPGIDLRPGGDGADRRVV